MKIDPPAFLSDPAAIRVLDALPEARIVGGAVRDALAGRPVADIDLATPLLPAEVAAALAEAGIRSVPTGLDHGTLTAVVAYTTDWREDAARRDFTINAMSMTREGTVADYFGGADDLRAGVVRFVGDGAARVAEDYLRILRFFRFFARYGSGPPDPAALAAIRGGITGLAGLSVERVWSELSGLLSVPDPGSAIALMARLGVLAAIVPEGASPDGLTMLLATGAPADPVLRLAALLTGEARPVAIRLKLSVTDRERLVALRQPPTTGPNDDDAALRRALAKAEPAIVVGRAWLAGEPALAARLAGIPRPVFPLEGRRIVALGIPPGPRVGLLLREVRAWWFARGCLDGADACVAEARRRMDF